MRSEQASNLSSVSRCVFGEGASAKTLKTKKSQFGFRGIPVHEGKRGGFWNAQAHHPDSRIAYERLPCAPGIRKHVNDRAFTHDA